MLTPTLAHAGRPPAPHDVWTSWSVEPVTVAAVVIALLLHWRGARGRHGERAWRDLWFGVGVATIVVALLSPLDAIAQALASAHMVQHLLLLTVAAPLLALSAPTTTLLRGSPATLRRPLGRLVGRVRRSALAQIGRSPVAVVFVHGGVLWLWHAAVLYDAALAHPVVHAAEHATFLLAGYWLWRVAVSSVRTDTPSPGAAILLLFATTMQGTFLAALLTFSAAPWYSAYAGTTQPWGLTPLADQQLAGAIMWVPGGIVYALAALALVARWLADGETQPVQRLPDAGSPGPA